MHTPPPTLDRKTIASLLPDDDNNNNNNKKHQYRMVAFDLDGTLLNEHHKLSSETKDYVRYLMLRDADADADAAGFTVCFATGRAIGTVYEHIRDLNLVNIPIPVVSSNGACAFECKVVETDDGDDDDDGHGERRVESKPLFATPVPEAVARKTIQLARQYGHCSQYYAGDEILADPIIITTTPAASSSSSPQQSDTITSSTEDTTSSSSLSSHHLELTQRYKDLTGAQTIYLPHDEQFEETCLRKGCPSKQLILFPHAIQDEMMAVVERAMQDPKLIAASTATLDDDHNEEPLKSAATIVRGNLGWFLEILHPTICKGKGLQRLCQEHLRVPLDDCIAFGDGDNDVEFLRMAGLGIAMVNGRAVAKQAADVMTTLPHDKNGVIVTLQLLEQHGKLHFTKSTSRKYPLASPMTTTMSTASLSSSSSSSSSYSKSNPTGQINATTNNDDESSSAMETSVVGRQQFSDTVEL